MIAMLGSGSEPVKRLLAMSVGWCDKEFIVAVPGFVFRSIKSLNETLPTIPAFQ